MAVAISVIWAGVVAGSVYALLALSYFLLFRATGVLNFAVGGIAGVAGIAAATSNRLTVVAIAIGLVYAVGVSVGIDLFVTRFVQARETTHFGTVLALAATLFVLIQLVGEAFTRATALGKPLVNGHIVIGSNSFTWHEIVLTLGTIAATASVFIWLRHGRRGRLLAAVGDDPVAARTICLPIAAVRLLTVSLAGLVAGLAGTMFVGYAPLDFQSGLHLSLVGFIAVVIGGLASVWGSLVGGLLLGVIESLGGWFFGARWNDYVLLAVVLITFRLRPEGLFASSVRSWD
jgi:branched-chain amino acid transport system permease protein